MIDPTSIYAAPDFMPYWVNNLEEDAYFADKTAVNSSALSLMLKSPKAFYYGFFKGLQKPVTKDLKLGKLIHQAVLEGDKFKQNYVIMPEFVGYTQKGEKTTNPNCKEVKELKQEWLNSLPPTAIIVTPDEREMIVGIIESILSHPDGQYLFNNGMPEKSGFFRDIDTNIKCKIRCDFISNDHNILIDLKSARSVSRVQFGSSAYNLRYDMRMAMYREGVKQITGKYPEVTVLVAVEKLCPWECAIYYYSNEDFLQADHDYKRCLSLVNSSIKYNMWPQNQKKIERLYKPAWFVNEVAVNEEMDNYIA